MKKLFTLLTMLIVAISTSWAATDSYDVTAWTGSTGTKTFNMADDAITVTAYIQSKTYNNTGSTKVAYLSGTNYLKFSATSACINSISLTANTDNNSNTKKVKYSISSDGTTWGAEVTYDGTFSNRQSTPTKHTITFDSPVQYVRFTNAENNNISVGAIEIDYSTGGGSTKTATTTAITSASKEALNVDLKNGTSAGTLVATVVSGDPATAVEGASVSWESTNESVATINASTGAVTLVATGTTTLKATYAGNDDYATSNDSYQITVTDTRTALTASWDNAAPTFSIDEAATNPVFTVTGGEAELGTHYTVAYAVESDENNILTVDANDGITDINTNNVGTATVKATVTVTSGAYKIATTEYNCVITVANTHSVTYDANGGSGTAPTDATSYASGASVKVADNIGTLTKAGYSVVGWNTNSGATTASQAFGSNLTMGDADVTLYAIWQKNDYTFTPKTVTADEVIAENATVNNSVGGVMKNTQAASGELLKYTTNGLLFGTSGNCNVTVTLNKDLQAGSVIIATLCYNDGNNDRELDLRKTASGSNIQSWVFSGDGKEHVFAYTVGATNDGLSGTNSFVIKRAKNAWLKSLKVTNCNNESYYVTVGESGFATIGMPFATTLPTGVTGYAVESVNSSKVKMSSAIEPATTIPANTGLVIVAAPATYKFSQTGAGTWSGSNLLEAVGETPKAATTEDPIYVLTITDATNKKVGFKKATSGSLGAYKAYLPGNVSNQNSLSISLDDDATAINGIAEAEANAEAPVKVIKNGKLFIGNFNVAGQQVK